MELTVFQIVLVTEFLIISALPLEQFHEVPSTHLQPVYWVRSTSSGQLPGSVTPHVASFYREVPSSPPAPAPGPPPPPFAQYKPSPVITSSLDVPTTRIDGINSAGYVLRSPSADDKILEQGPFGFSSIKSEIPSNFVAPIAFLPPTVFEQKPQTPVLSDEIIPSVTSDSPMESVKHNTTNTTKRINDTPQVTIFAPGSLFDSDSFLNILRKSLADSRTSVFVYAPGSLFTSQDETTRAKPFLGNHLSSDFSNITLFPRPVDNPKQQISTLSETVHKETENKKELGTNKSQDLEESEEIDDGEKEKDD